MHNPCVQYPQHIHIPHTVAADIPSSHSTTTPMHMRNAPHAACLQLRRSGTTIIAATCTLQNNLLTRFSLQTW